MPRLIRCLWNPGLCSALACEATSCLLNGDDTDPWGTMVADQSKPPLGAKAELFAERVALAEHLLAAQRLRISQLEADGFDLARPRALLRLMEAIAEQFRIACQLFEAHERSPRRLASELDSPGFPAQGRIHRAPGEPPPTSLTSELAAFPCPHCGMRLALKSDEGMLVYDIDQWRRQCQHQGLQTPVLCQVFPSSTDMIH